MDPAPATLSNLELTQMTRDLRNHVSGLHHGLTLCVLLATLIDGFVQYSGAIFRSDQRISRVALHVIEHLMTGATTQNLPEIGWFRSRVVQVRELFGRKGLVSSLNPVSGHLLTGMREPIMVGFFEPFDQTCCCR